nr:m7gpppx diphosphatase [Quercus suber]
MATTALLSEFKFKSILRSDSGGKRMILQGTISNAPALLLAERGAFTQDAQYWTEFPQLLSHIQTLGDNDVYKWFLANSLPEKPDATACPPDLKINLIYPCTDKHIRKYSFQQSRVVLETPEIYTRFVRPYMARCREQGRLNWVFNILSGAAEQENVLFRSSEPNPQDDFLLLPDLNWDRKTLGSMHLLALVQRRDLWSVRDLRKRDVPWLRHFRDTLMRTVVEQLYPGTVEPDLLKFYVHYQPTYYHFHVHVVHVDCEPTATQAVGKALGLDHVLSQLETMGGGEDAGMADVQLGYTVGEASELWMEIFEPLKRGTEPRSVVVPYRETRLDTVDSCLRFKASQRRAWLYADGIPAAAVTIRAADSKAACCGIGMQGRCPRHAD